MSIGVKEKLLLPTDGTWQLLGRPVGVTADARVATHAPKTARAEVVTALGTGARDRWTPNASDPNAFGRPKVSGGVA